MLIRLEIENFYSIRDAQVLDLSVAKTAPKDRRFQTIYASENLRIPKVVALFGANASGKTTILRAISFLRQFATRSFKDYEPDERIRVYPFDCAEDRLRPTRLAVEFVPWVEPNDEGTVYRYELHVQHTKDTNFVSWEALRIRTARGKFSSIFERGAEAGGKNDEIRDSQLLSLRPDDPRREVRRNVSLLSSLVQYGHKDAEHFSNVIELNFITNISLGRTKFTEKYVSEYLSKHEFALDHLNRLIRVIDVGIEKVELIEIDGTKSAVFKHSGLDGVKTLAFESQGTQNFFCLFPNLTYSLNTGATAVLDEIDSDLHPSLLFEIVRWFWDGRENSQQSQLVMSCQHASLLNSLVKEEVFFTEKDDSGATKVQRLASMDALRRDANLYKKYMSGEFGALPRFG